MRISKLSFFLGTLILCSFFHVPAFAVKKSYIVYLGSHSHGPDVSLETLDQVADSHHQLLGSFLGSHEKAQDAIFYSYTRHINGFAATLEEAAAAKISKHPGVISVFPNKPRQLHTTHSWEFMHLEENGVVPPSLWMQARFGEDTIIGNLDTGVWPESQSFSANGIGPVPARWKGICENNTASGVHCNRKLIGARYFNKGYLAGSNVKADSLFESARDHDGHGSHTLSTAGGNFVPGASVFGVGNGTAKGGSPRARVASYKVCWPYINGTGGGCYDADILAAFEMAIHDGVDVLSLSLGGPPTHYFHDAVAIGAFHAVKHGITVVCSAGNSGPQPGSVSNVAPWILTVAASTLDREFQAFVELPNGKSFKGESMSKALPKDSMYPLITGSHAKRSNASTGDALLCKKETLDPHKARGKIVVCLRGKNARIEKGREVFLAGAAGMILCNGKIDGYEVVADPHVLPATHISYEAGLAVFSYINSTRHPMGYISPPKAVLGMKQAPSMAGFSSQGPNMVTPDILKPDITAPGVDIIAAYTGEKSPTNFAFDKRRTPFIVESGTSMSCPHVSGVVGLLKTMHPKWSHAAIRSAIMTTARTRDNRESPVLNGSNVEANPFNYGSGHIRPNRAMDPGLVYDLTINDYLDFLCAIGYNETMIRSFSERRYNCPKHASLLDFNYPSISVPNLSKSVTVTRMLKNVGSPGRYVVWIREPYGVSVTVKPRVLRFERVSQVRRFKITMKPKWDGAAKDFTFGGVTWSDGKHYVRSPIAVAARFIV